MWVDFDDVFKNCQQRYKVQMIKFSGDQNNYLYPGIFNRIFLIVLIRNIGGIGPWRRFVLSLVLIMSVS